MELINARRLTAIEMEKASQGIRYSGREAQVGIGGGPGGRLMRYFALRYPMSEIKLNVTTRTFRVSDEDEIEDVWVDLQDLTQWADTARKITNLATHIKKHIPKFWAVAKPSNENSARIGQQILKACADMITFSIRQGASHALGGKAEIDIKDVRLGIIPAFLAALHEFGHFFDIRLREKYWQISPEVVDHWGDAIRPRPQVTDHKNHQLEVFADCFAALFLRATGVDELRLMDGVECLLGNELASISHPPGPDRVRRIKNRLHQLGPTTHL